MIKNCHTFLSYEQQISIYHEVKQMVFGFDRINLPISKSDSRRFQYLFFD